MKPFLSVSLLAMSINSIAYARAMGPVDVAPVLYTFVGAEGGYTWNDIDSINIIHTNDGTLQSHGSTSIQNSGGSARVYAGLMRLIFRDALYFSGEVGWGYYGKSTLTLNYTPYNDSSNLNGSTLSDSFNGFDALGCVDNS